MPDNKRSKKPKIKTPLSQRILGDIYRELKKTKSSSLSGFHTFPKTVKFETQEVKERIILLLRRHLITNLPWILVSIFLFLIPALIKQMGALDILPPGFQFMTLIIWYLFVSAFVIEKSLSWYFNVYIITDERVVDVDFYSLIYKRISDAKIDRIEDVTYSQGGFIQSLFNYGLVNIQTAGEEAEFEFEAVPKPAQVAKVINQLILQEEQEKIEGRVS